MTISYQFSDEDDVFLATLEEQYKISAGAGNNTITTLNGDDEIKASNGDDIIDAGNGNNRVNAGEGNNTVITGNGNDRIKTSSGNDIIDAGEGNNEIVSGEGDDIVITGSGDDDIKTSKGNDIISSGRGNDQVDGGDGIDTLIETGSILEFFWTGSSSSLELESQAAGYVKSLQDIEILQFDDFVFDLLQNNGMLVLADDQATDEDTAVSFDVSAFDFDGGDASLVGASVTGGGSVTVSLVDPDLVQNMGVGESLSVTFDPNGAYEYLAAGETVTETVTLTFEDGQGATTIQTIDVTISGADDGISDGEFNAAFATGSFLPWGQEEYGQSMDAAFGAGNWDQYLGTSANLFDGSYDFVWLDGGDAQAGWLQNYLDTYSDEIEQFVSHGGTVYINAARNTAYSPIDLGFGATLVNSRDDGVSYETYNQSALITDAGAVLQTGGATNISSYTGNYFTHDSIQDDDGDLTVFIEGGNEGTIALAGQEFGDGFAMFGGITSSNYHSPNNAADALEANILSYVASFADDFAFA